MATARNTQILRGHQVATSTVSWTMPRSTQSISKQPKRPRYINAKVIPRVKKVRVSILYSVLVALRLTFPLTPPMDHLFFDLFWAVLSQRCCMKEREELV